MKNYELVYIVSGNFTENEVPKVIEKIEAVLLKYGAVLGYKKDLGKKKLAYPINKSLHGYYIVTEFELAEGPKLQEINNYLRLDKEILRAQIITKAKITAKEIERQERRAKMGDGETSDEMRERVERGERRERPERKERPAPVVEKPITPVDKKQKMKNLDEKLEEILKDGSII